MGECPDNFIHPDRGLSRRFFYPARCLSQQFFVRMKNLSGQTPIRLKKIVPMVVHYVDDFIILRDDILMFQHRLQKKKSQQIQNSHLEIFHMSAYQFINSLGHTYLLLEVDNSTFDRKITNLSQYALCKSFQLLSANLHKNKWRTPKNVNRNKKEIPMIEDICG